MKGVKLCVYWGRIGTSGTSQEKEFNRYSRAYVAAQSLIFQKISKGYVEEFPGRTKEVAYKAKAAQAKSKVKTRAKPRPKKVRAVPPKVSPMESRFAGIEIDFDQED